MLSGHLKVKLKNIKFSQRHIVTQIQALTLRVHDPTPL